MPLVTEGIIRGSESFKEEFFGPVFNLYKVKNAKEALEFANDSDYGLAATVFSEDKDLTEMFADKLSVGSVTINDMVASFSDMPSGGIKMSGQGRECSKDGLVELGNVKSIISKF